MSAFTEANRQAFNDLSAIYNTKEWQRRISAQISNALQARKDWIGVQWVKPGESADKRDVRLLDYACGTGAITQALGSWVTTIRGIDISENMVDKYNEAATFSGLKPEQAHAVVGDLLVKDVDKSLIEPDFQHFDVAVIALGLHHMEDPSLAVKRLAERVKPGSGVLVVIDFLPFTHPHSKSSSDTAHDHPDISHTIKHHGFTREDMEKLYGEAGLEGLGWDVMDEPVVMELKHGRSERTIFIARGTRTSDG